MALDELRAAAEALSVFRGQAVHVSIENANGMLGAWAEFTGFLGEPEVDRGGIKFPVTIRGSNEDDRFCIDGESFESWGQMQGRVRLVANGLAILVRAAT